VPAFGGVARGRATRLHHADRRPWRTRRASRSDGSLRALRPTEPAGPGSRFSPWGPRPQPTRHRVRADGG
jgi:hypothetical protein